MSSDAIALALDNNVPPVIHPWEDFEAILRHAKKAQANNDKPRACTLYARAIELNCNDARGWAGYAATTPSVDEAIVSWGYALALNANNAEARAELNVLVEDKIKNSMIAQVENPALATSFVTLGRALAEAGQRSWAYRLLVRATQLDGANEDAWMWRGGVTEDIAETISCLNEALKLNPNNPRAHAGLRWAQTRQSAAPASRTAAERAAQWIYDAQRAVQTGDLEHSYELLKNATELDPQNLTAWIWRGGVCADVDEALACMEQALALNPASEAAKDAVWWLRVRKLRERARAQARVFASSISASFSRVPKAAPLPAETKRRLSPVALIIGALTLLLLVIIVASILLR